MKIENQYNYGGNQTYADLIINSQSNSLSEVDRKFIDLINKNTQNQEEKVELIESLTSLKNEDEDLAKKEKSANLLSEFLKSGAGEAGKSIVKELVESGADYLSVLI